MFPCLSSTPFISSILPVLSLKPHLVPPEMPSALTRIKMFLPSWWQILELVLLASKGIEAIRVATISGTQKPVGMSADPSANMCKPASSRSVGLSPVPASCLNRILMRHACDSPANSLHLMHLMHLVVWGAKRGSRNSEQKIRSTLQTQCFRFLIFSHVQRSTSNQPRTVICVGL